MDGFFYNILHNEILLIIKDHREMGSGVDEILLFACGNFQSIGVIMF